MKPAANQDNRSTPMVQREISAGVYWLGGCLVIDTVTHPIHSHMNCYLIVGSEKTVLVDTGHPMDWPVFQDTLLKILDGRPLDYILPTHQEYPHMGNLGDLLELFPKAQVIGNVQDYHLYFPGTEDQLVGADIGSSIELGGRKLQVLPAPIRDLKTTVWAYDTDSQTMFVSDGFAYSHEHYEDECDLLSTELEWEPTKEDVTYTNTRALHWTKFVDSAPLFDEVEQLIKKHPTKLIGPAHGNVISDPENIVKLMRDMMRDVSEEWQSTHVPTKLEA